jgi:hypothetical protein
MLCRLAAQRAAGDLQEILRAHRLYIEWGGSRIAMGRTVVHLD